MHQIKADISGFHLSPHVWDSGHCGGGQIQKYGKKWQFFSVPTFAKMILPPLNTPERPKMSIKIVPLGQTKVFVHGNKRSDNIVTNYGQ